MSTNTPNQKRHRIQMDTRMRELFPDLERIFTARTNTQIPQPPSQLHTLHRCIKIRICRHTATTQHSNGMDHPITYVSGLFRGSQLNWANSQRKPTQSTCQ